MKKSLFLQVIFILAFDTLFLMANDNRSMAAPEANQAKNPMSSAAVQKSQKTHETMPAKEPAFKDLPGEGKKCKIDENSYFIYEFTKKPQLGTVILRIQVYNGSGNQISSFKISGRYDMPAMSGAHDSGDQEFKLNKKGDYLLPVNIAMPGEWEFKLIFSKDGTPIFYGRFTFDV